MDNPRHLTALQHEGCHCRRLPTVIQCKGSGMCLPCVYRIMLAGHAYTAQLCKTHMDYWVVKAVIILHHEQGSRGHLRAASSAVNDSSGSLTPTIIFCEATVSSDVLVNVKCFTHFALQEFLEAYKGVDFTKSPEKYFKYSVKDIHAMLLETFAR